MSKDEMIVYTNDMINSCKERIAYYKEDLKETKDTWIIKSLNFLISMENKELEYFESVKKVLGER